MIISTPFLLGCKPVTELPPVLNLPVPIYTGLREAPQGGESKASCPKTHRLRLQTETLDPESSAPTLRPPRLPRAGPKGVDTVEEKSRKAVKGKGLGISLP